MDPPEPFPLAAWRWSSDYAATHFNMSYVCSVDQLASQIN